MKLRFLGTRGNTEVRSVLLWMHSAVMVAHRGQFLMIDCGADWLGQLHHLGPGAIIITHTHSDHVWGLRGGAPCAVYATEEAMHVLAGYGIADLRVIEPRRATAIQGMSVEAFPVEHSIRAPAVGYRVSAGRVTIFYAPDRASILDPDAALREIRMYVGDGATINRSMVRRRDGALIRFHGRRGMVGANLVFAPSGRSQGSPLQHPAIFMVKQYYRSRTDPYPARLVPGGESPAGRVHPLRLRDRERQRN